MRHVVAVVLASVLFLMPAVTASFGSQEFTGSGAGVILQDYDSAPQCASATTISVTFTPGVGWRQQGQVELEAPTALCGPWFGRSTMVFGYCYHSAKTIECAGVDRCSSIAASRLVLGPGHFCEDHIRISDDGTVLARGWEFYDDPSPYGDGQETDAYWQLRGVVIFDE